MHAEAVHWKRLRSGKQAHYDIFVVGTGCWNGSDAKLDCWSLGQAEANFSILGFAFFGNVELGHDLDA